MTELLAKLRRARIYKNGGSLFIPLPRTWTEDMGLAAKGEVDIFRDNKDRLIIVPAKKPKKHQVEE